MTAGPLTNFGFLKTHDKQLVRLGMFAERYFADDPNTCLLKLRQLTELLPQLTPQEASRANTKNGGLSDRAAGNGAVSLKWREL